MGLETQGGKPTGRTGRFIGKIMNQFHTPHYKELLKEIELNNDSTILDIGCGGGSVLKFMSELNPNFKLIGLDHSAEMIELTQKVNAKAFQDNRLKTILGSVSKIDCEDKTLELVTAFETIQFWPDHDLAFAQIHRLLKDNGQILIVNRYPKEGSKWWKLAKLKSKDDYLKILSEYNFTNIQLDLERLKGWIVVKATKA